MLPPIYIATLAGIASALLLLAPIGSAFAAVPIGIVALGWGVLHGIQAALAGFIGLTFLVLIFNASMQVPILYFAFFTAAPILILAHLSSLSRKFTVQKDGEEQTSQEWFPVGNLLFWTATIASVLTVVLILKDGASYASYVKNVSPIIAKTIDWLQKAGTTDLRPEQLEVIKQAMLFYFPIFMGISFVLQIMLNFWFAAKITEKSELLKRPWPDIRGMEIPSISFVVLICALVLAVLLPGMPRYVILCVFGAFLSLVVISGLTVIHTLIQHMELRIPILMTVYFCLIVIAVPTIFIITLFGVAEHFLKLKQRALEKAAGDKSDPS